MSTTDVSSLTEILNRLVERSSRGEVKWMKTLVEGSRQNFLEEYTVYFSPKTSLSVCYRSPAAAPDKVIVTVDRGDDLVWTYSVEDGQVPSGEDFISYERCYELFDVARRSALDFDDTFDEIARALNSDAPVGIDPEKQTAP